MRLAPFFGGDPNLTVQLIIYNDTGSDCQSLYSTELNILQYDPNNYNGRIGSTVVNTAAGRVNRDAIFVEVMVLKNDGTPVTGWILERGLVQPFPPGIGDCRLSGAGIRDHLYFATAPGNHNLFISQKKNGIVSRLPAL
jgi:hypothetical protein